MLNGMKVYETHIEYDGYSFEPSMIHGKHHLSMEEIDCVIENFIPPAVVVGEEIVFFSAEYKKEVKAFADRNSIDIVYVEDLWSWILEPFLDTDFDTKTSGYCYQKLQEYDLGQTEVDQIRATQTPRMLYYNYDTNLWEWAYLGLYDLLSACVDPVMSSEDHRMDAETFRNYYKEVMLLALKGKRKKYH